LPTRSASPDSPTQQPGFRRTSAATPTPTPSKQKPELKTVSSDADFVIESYVDTREASRDEGPFCDHTGYYTLLEPYPVPHGLTRGPTSLHRNYRTLTGSPSSSSTLPNSCIRRRCWRSLLLDR